MRIVGFHENSIAPHCHAAIEMPRRVVDESFRNRPSMMPDYASGTGIESKGVIRCSDEHDAVDDDRRNFQTIGVAARGKPIVHAKFLRFLY